MQIVDQDGAFDECFRGYAARVHAFALRRSDPQAAQDITAETFLIAWRRRAEMPDEPLPWLYGIARRVLANEQRAANRRGALTGRMRTQAAPHEPRPAGERSVLQALAILRESDREALLLCAWEGLTVKEAALVAGCSAGAFAVRLHRARRRLSSLMEQIDQEPAPVPARDPLTEVPR